MIFLSHAHEDAQLARILASDLEATFLKGGGYAADIFCTAEPRWEFNAEQNDGGAAFDDELWDYLSANLRESTFYVQFVTGRSLEKVKSWANRELKAAEERAVRVAHPFLLPVLEPGVDTSLVPESKWGIEPVCLGEEDGIEQLAHQLVRHLANPTRRGARHY